MQAIIQNPEQVLDTFNFQEADNQKVGKLSKSLDGGKSTGEDKIPPKLVSLAANELTNDCNKTFSVAFKQMEHNFLATHCKT